MTEEKISNEKSEEKVSSRENDQMHLSQRGVLYNRDSGKYLIAKEIRFREENGTWQVPGGRVQKGEALPESFVRELEEELGLSTENYENAGYIDYNLQTLYASDTISGTLTFQLLFYKTGAITLSDEHGEYKWQTAAEIQESDDYKQWLKDVIAKAEEKREQIEARDKMLRTLAEFDNYKKRSVEEKKDFTKYASERVIMDMLPVLDNFHAATSFVPEDQKESPWLTGIMYIQQQMEKVFEDAGVAAIDISVGSPFDPETMESLEVKLDSEEIVVTEESEKTSSERKVTKIIQKGYKIGDRVMRPARVEIS